MAKKMKAAFIDQFGGPEVIKYDELPIPEINENQILVKTLATSLDHIDTYIRAGKVQQPITFPHILGHDLVGVVEQVGSKVTQFKPGQKVWSNSFGENGRQGSWAEYVAGEEILFNPMPFQVEDLAMVSNIHSAITVCHGLIRVAKLLANEVLFVSGGAGAIGTALIQLANARGAKVYAATSDDVEKQEWCKSCGAEEVFNYKDKNYENQIHEQIPNGVDVFWDTSWAHDFDVSTAVTKKEGRIIVMSGAESRSVLPIGPFYRKDLMLKGYSILNVPLEKLRDYTDIINRCVKEHVLRARIAEILSLPQAAKAHALIESKQLWGKIVVKM